MISREDIQRLIHRPVGAHPVLSVFLDMSVTSENKRTHPVFLNRWRSEHAELASDRPGHHREALGAAYAAVERWIDMEFEEVNKGVAVYTEIGGDWLEGLQFPVPVASRRVIQDEPVVGPLVQLLDEQHHHGLVLVDREHLRLMSVYLGRTLHHHEVKTEPYPAPHDVRAGGYSAPVFQRRKAEEVRHYFKEFAVEVAEFQRRYRPDDLILLGTDENVKHFLDFLPAAIRKSVVHTRHAPIDAAPAELMQRLEPFFSAQRERRAAAVVDALRARVGQGHFAVAGFPDALEQLQEGKVETLILARDLERAGSRCTRCRFFLADHAASCPFCGGALRDGVDLVEAAIRMAEVQGASVAFAPGGAMAELDGVGALLRF